MLKQFLTRKKVFGALVLVLLIAGIFGVSNQALASELGDFIAQAVASLGALLIEYVLGPILLILINILIWISGYNDFINSIAVINGWAMVRDVANMFFIIVLLIVAFGTILGQEEYHYKKLLPKLVVMALFINFSRTLAGLLIDAGQVVMITFVNGYAAAAGGNFANALGITKIMSIKESEIAITQPGIAGAVVLGAIMLIVSIMTVSAMLAVLALRIVMLWALIVLSPIAWLLSTIPQGQKYYAQWWEEFRNQVVVGPVLAFFLWLSLASVGSGLAWQQVGQDLKPGDSPTAGITEFGDITTITSFIVSISMLLVGLHVAQQFGGAIAGMASKGKAFAAKGLKTAAKLSVGGALMAGAYGARKAKAGELPLIGKLTKGLEFNPANIYRNLKQGFAAKRERTERKGRIYAGEQMEKGGVWGAISGIGAPNWVENYAEGFMYNKGIKRAIYGKRGRAEVLDGKAKEEEELAAKEQNLRETSLGYTDTEKNSMRQQRGGLQGEHDAMSGVMRSGATGDLNAMPAMKETLRRILETLKSKASEEKDPMRKSAIQGEITQVETALSSNTLKLDPAMSFTMDLQNEINSEIGKKVAGMQELDAKLQGPTVSETDPRYLASKNKSDAHRQKAQSLHARAERAAAWTPIDYEARAERRSLAAAEMKKISTSNEDELISLMKAALERHDPLMAQAVAYQAASVGHLNELLNGFTASKDHKNERTGETEARQGQSFEASGLGLNAFVKDIFMKDLGFGREAALSIQNDLSATARSIHHWTYAETVGASADGSFYQRGSEEQGLRNAVERSKLDYQELLRRGNRLSIMNERWIDEKDHDKGRIAELTPLGVTEIRRNFRSWKYSLSRNQVNPNLVMNLARPQNMEVLLKIRTSLDPRGQTDFDSHFLGPLKEAIGTVTDKESKGIGQALKKEIEQARGILQTSSP